MYQKQIRAAVWLFDVVQMLRNVSKDSQIPSGFRDVAELIGGLEMEACEISAFVGVQRML